MGSLWAGTGDPELPRLPGSAQESRRPRQPVRGMLELVKGVVVSLAVPRRPPRCLPPAVSRRPSESSPRPSGLTAGHGARAGGSSASVPPDARACSALPGTLASPARCGLSGQVCALVTKTPAGNRIRMGSGLCYETLFLMAKQASLEAAAAGVTGLWLTRPASPGPPGGRPLRPLASVNSWGALSQRKEPAVSPGRSDYLSGGQASAL